MNLRNWIQQPDNTFKAIDVPGPPDFDALFACFKVYRAILHMLRYPLQPSDPGGMSRTVVTLTALDAYMEAFRVLSGEFPECWHWITIQECHGMRSSRFWHTMQTKEVRRRAFQVITRDSFTLLLAPMVTFGTAHAPQNLASASGQLTLPDGSRAGSFLFQGQSRFVKQKRTEREKHANAFLGAGTNPHAGQRQVHTGTAGKGRKPSPAHPRKMERLYVTTSICFRFSKGHTDVCASHRQEGRTHALSVVLGALSQRLVSNGRGGCCED